MVAVRQRNSLTPVSHAAGPSSAHPARYSGDFLSDAAHEIRSPLARLKGYADLLAHGEMPLEEVQRLCSRIQSQADRLVATVDDLLELASLEASGACNFHFRPTCPQSLVEEALDGLDPAELDRISVVVHPPAMPQVLVDHRRITRVLINLLENACKYSPPAQAIQVSISLRRGWSDRAVVTFHVRDRGIGINSEDARHVFERFFRSEAARSRPGSGLGLSIAKEIVRLHHGQIRLRGRPGLGTIASLILPAAR